MSSIPTASAARPNSKVSRHRILPGKEERCFIPLSLNSAMDVNLELFCMLTRQTKNGLVQEMLTRFLSKNSSCEAAHERTFPSDQKNRVTFVISRDVQKKLETFAKQAGCHQACAVTAALIKFLKANGIDPYADPSERLLRQLQRQLRSRRPSGKSRSSSKLQANRR